MSQSLTSHSCQRNKGKGKQSPNPNSGARANITLHKSHAKRRPITHIS